MYSSLKNHLLNIYCARHWGYSCEPDKDPCPCGADILDNKDNTYEVMYSRSDDDKFLKIKKEERGIGS